MTKKNITGLFMVFFTILGIGVYFYAYQDHRDIAKEKGNFEVIATEIFMEFQDNEKEATAKYLDKTIIVSGKVDSFDPSTQSVFLDGKVFATFLNEIPQEIELNAEITLKGRLIGYDSLLGELKMDQCIIIK